MSNIRRNVELKARYPNLDHARAIAREMGAEFAAVLNQCDTYFQTPNGRLKLREINGERAELIWYDRPNNTELKTSRYQLVPTPDPELLKTTLTAALGVRVIVEKRRELFLFRNVRIHLDEVSQLGCFLEFEAVLEPDQPEAEGYKLLAELRKRFGISDADLLAGSYGEMLGVE